MQTFQQAYDITAQQDLMLVLGFLSLFVVAAAITQLCLHFTRK